MPPAVWFAYSPDRKGIHPQNHLAGYSGVLQADAYGGYRALYESGRITEAACMAHARRKIHDVHARAPTDITTEALQRIGELYAIEAEVRGCSAEQRLAARKARAAPLMQSLYDWIQQQMKTLSSHSDTAKAFTYLLKQWEALNVYCSNGWGKSTTTSQRTPYGECRRPEELAVRGFRQRWRTCGGVVLADRHMPSEQCGARKMAALRY